MGYWRLRQCFSICSMAYKLGLVFFMISGSIFNCMLFHYSEQNYQLVILNTINMCRIYGFK